ncbi:hypothetical protein PU629_10615 [Pullulanibacillus sp. KACC 23026]|uniref:hypothetical protein n=1 Tax=Pullulanibacillus sp. KACC 23026 TaxID=3028315 RepID=UPI0023B0B5F4|nr:hypothetical protein [Pullulanibacillus sp. KACC 23026]WEG14764.1 hypothetical protein PU629_10615 [Pullulanibacillus sp. KACC 23026]
MTYILLGDMKESIPELERLIEAVLNLVNQHYPYLIIDAYRQKAQFVRREN